MTHSMLLRSTKCVECPSFGARTEERVWRMGIGLRVAGVRSFCIGGFHIWRPQNFGIFFTRIPPLSPQNLYCLSANLLHFLTPSRLLCGRHLWNIPLSGRGRSAVPAMMMVAAEGSRGSGRSPWTWACACKGSRPMPSRSLSFGGELPCMQPSISRKRGCPACLPSCNDWQPFSNKGG